jgi:hypothetical protein
MTLEDEIIMKSGKGYKIHVTLKTTRQFRFRARIAKFCFWLGVKIFGANIEITEEMP